MKKLALLLLAVIVTACAAPATPTQELAPTVVEPTATPVVVVQTVVVEATQAPTDVPVPTAVPPTAVPPTAAVVTVVVQPTTAAATNPNAVANGMVSIDGGLGSGVFVNMTMSSANLTLRCSPRDVTFNVTTANLDIADVQFYYRVVDLNRLYPSEWKASSKFTANGNGNFTFVFKGEDVSSDLRVDGSYIDFQFVGLARSGTVVDRSEKIESLLKYTFDCP